jgi:hypothetical protein
MPPKPSWLRRIPEMRATLKGVEAPLLDRASLERLFRVSPRRAMKLAHEIGAVEVGHSLVIERWKVARFLEARQLGRAVQVEKVRRQRLREAIDEARRDVVARSVKIPVSPAVVAEATLASLPRTIELGRRELRIAFKDAGDLLQQLFTLSKAIGRDFQAFERATAGTQAGATPASRG